MEWYYAINNRQYGPVSEAALGERLRAGVITEDSLVWRAGLTDWQPLRTALPALTGVPPAHRVCAECLQFFPESEMLCLNHAWVCAQCKPVLLQRMLEGAMPAVGIGQMWRKDRLLILHPETEFPDRCVRCNAPANGFRLKCHLHWAPTGRLVRVPARVTIQIGLCELHRVRRQRLVVGYALVVGIVGALIITGVLLGLGLAQGGLFLVLLCLFALSPITSVLSATKITDEVIWLRGAGEAFLATLPDWTGDR